MVFIWVSTGYSEPFVPKTPWSYTVPEVHPGHTTTSANNDTRFPSNPYNNPNPSMQNPSHSIHNPSSNPIQSYLDSQKIHKTGDRIVFVWEIMTEPVDTLEEEDLLEKAKNLFRERRYRHIPIVNNIGKLTGIISDRDILKYLADGINFNTRIRNQMIKKVLTATPDTKIRDAAYVMVTEKIGCLPVINPEEKPIGILTRSDILKCIVKKPPLDLYA